MHYPRTVAAHRLQTWLLVTALVAVFLTAMLAVDLARNLRSVVISEANKALANAVSELAAVSSFLGECPKEVSRKGLPGSRAAAGLL